MHHKLELFRIAQTALSALGINVFNLVPDLLRKYVVSGTKNKIK